MHAREGERRAHSAWQSVRWTASCHDSGASGDGFDIAVWPHRFPLPARIARRPATIHTFLNAIRSNQGQCMVRARCSSPPLRTQRFLRFVVWLGRLSCTLHANIYARCGRAVIAHTVRRLASAETL